jgi:hypothetical protein
VDGGRGGGAAGVAAAACDAVRCPANVHTHNTQHTPNQQGFIQMMNWFLLPPGEALER